MVKDLKSNLITSIISLLLFLMGSLIFSLLTKAIFSTSITNAMLSIGIFITAIGSLSLSSSHDFSNAINPYRGIDPIYATPYNDNVSKREYDIEKNHTNYIKNTITIINRRDIEFTTCGLILIILSII